MRRAAAFTVAYAALGICLVRASSVGAQPPPPPPDTRTARERAPIDLTGQWVAVVNEDWRWRMVTPPVGDAASIPLNAKGRAETAAWDFDKDRREGGFCKAFGPLGLIRQPTRVRIDWQDADTLRLQFDAGNQTRLLHFVPQAPGRRSLQGDSTATWFRQTQSRGVFAANTPDTGGSLQVHTRNMAAGYLRPNGVPYGENATVKEFLNTFTTAAPISRGTRGATLTPLPSMAKRRDRTDSLSATVEGRGKRGQRERRAAETEAAQWGRTHRDRGGSARRAQNAVVVFLLFFCCFFVCFFVGGFCVFFVVVFLLFFCCFFCCFFVVFGCFLVVCYLLVVFGFFFPTLSIIRGYQVD
jgi:hypothetical protein